jgi:hypothetical protein
MGTPSNGPRSAPGIDSTTKSSARSPAPTSNLNDAKPQIAMTAIQFPVSLTACPARSSAKPLTRSTRMPQR